MTKSQKQNILEALEHGEILSPLEALNRFGCFRLGARIYEIRKAGYDVENIGSDDGQYARYRLKPKAVALPPAFPLKQKETNQTLFP